MPKHYSSIKLVRPRTKSQYRLFDKKHCVLGDNGGGETLYIEFKQFCILAIDNIFNNTQIEEFLYYEHRLDKDLFNEMIYNIINKNIKKYIAKYLGVFSKAQINGELYFGVCDLGFLDGIPFYGILDIERINDMITEAINENTRGAYLDDRYITEEEQLHIRDLYNNIKCYIKELHTPQIDTVEYCQLKDKQLQLLVELEEKKKVLDDIWTNYNHSHKQYILKLNRYNSGIVNYLFNPDLRKEIIEYVKLDFAQDNTLDKQHLNSIIKFYSHVNKYYRGMSFSDEDVSIIKNIKYDPINWLLAYKDNMLNKIKQLRPETPTCKKQMTNVYLKFFNNMSNISSFLLPDVQLYVLKFSFPYIPNIYCEYKYPGCDAWQSKTRAIINGEVSCY